MSTAGAGVPAGTLPEPCGQECAQRSEPGACCGEEIAYTPFHWHGRRPVSGGWAHLDGRYLCRAVPGEIPQGARPVPRCSRCRSTEIRSEDTPWGIQTDCPACGYSSYFSLGD